MHPIDCLAKGSSLDSKGLYPSYCSFVEARSCDTLASNLFPSPAKVPSLYTWWSTRDLTPSVFTLLETLRFSCDSPSVYISVCLVDIMLAVCSLAAIVIESLRVTLNSGSESESRLAQTQDTYFSVPI